MEEELNKNSQHDIKNNAEQISEIYERQYRRYVKNLDEKTEVKV